jgi:ATP-dependent HslUV protease ATP-binding subunit HslU
MMIGPTGVGKTEIARRVAKLLDAPFVKVEATKFTEVGYVGRDVDSIIRDLAEVAFNMEHDRRLGEVRAMAESRANERIIDYLIEQREDLRQGKRPMRRAAMPIQAQAQAQAQAAVGGAVEAVAPAPEGAPQPSAPPAVSERALKVRRRRVERLLAENKLDEEQIEIDIQDGGLGMDDLGGVLEFVPGMSPDEMADSFNEFLDSYRSIQDTLGRKRVKRVSVREARRLLTDEESHKLLDLDSVVEDAIRRAEQSGVVFVDEIDKIAGPASETGPDVSGQGVQRDLLPIVEGSTVHTRYGPVKTDHMLFIAAGAFHSSRPSDLIPELQGRFPLRVELSSLGETELVAILSEPENSLIRQYTAMLATEGVQLGFSRDGMERIAHIATDLNERIEDIGARRLHTIMEQVLEDLSFRAEQEAGQDVVIDAAYVDGHLKDVVHDDDLSKFIL